MTGAGFGGRAAAITAVLRLGSGVSSGFWPQGCLKSQVQNGQRRSPISRTRAKSERRKWVRLPLAIPVFVRNEHSNSNEMLEFATVLNVSAGGMLVAVRRTRPVSSELRLEIPGAPVLTLLPKSSRELRARVLRSTPLEGYNLLGLKFSRPLLRSSTRRTVKKRKVLSVS